MKPCVLGMDISVIDLINIQAFASKVIGLTEYRSKLHTYLTSKMGSVAPNLTALVGEQVIIGIFSHFCLSYYLNLCTHGPVSS